MIFVRTIDIMRLPIKLQREIIDFLKSLPTLDDTESQRAFIYQAGFDKEVQEHIPFGKPLGQFVPLLVSILLKYGRLSNGQPALEVILETAQNYVGQDKKAYCAVLIQRLQETQSEVISPPVSLAFWYHRIGSVSVVVLCILIGGFWWYTQYQKPPILNHRIFDKNSVPTTDGLQDKSLCGTNTVTKPDVRIGADGTLYEVHSDFTKGKEEINPLACGRQYWIKRDKNHPYYDIRFVYLVDGYKNQVIGILYIENSDGSLIRYQASDF